MANAGQVHRFRDCVAAYVGNGETVYMTAKEARAFARALNRAARSVEREPFGKSQGLTQALAFADWTRAGEPIPALPRDAEGRAIKGGARHG